MGRVAFRSWFPRRTTPWDQIPTGGERFLTGILIWVCVRSDMLINVVMAL